MIVKLTIYTAQSTESSKKETENINIVSEWFTAACSKVIYTAT